MKTSFVTILPPLAVICFLLGLASAAAQRQADPASLPDAPMVRTAPTTEEPRDVLEIKGDWIVRAN